MNGAKSEGTGRDVVAPSLLGPLLSLACMDNRCAAVAAAAAGSVQASACLSHHGLVDSRTMVTTAVYLLHACVSFLHSPAPPHLAHADLINCCNCYHKKRSLTPAYYSLRRGANGALRELVTGSRIAQRRLLAPEHAAAYATLMGQVLQECGDHQTQVRAVRSQQRSRFYVTLQVLPHSCVVVVLVYTLLQSRLLWVLF
jgi:hypothetical protein